MSFVEYAVEASVAIITLIRPPVNALSGKLIDDLDRAISLAEDPGIRAVVVTGAPHFAAGADIAEFRAAMDEGGKDLLSGHLSAVVRRLELLPKPTIAAVRGFALGGGLELAMGCDFRLLADDARVGQPEIKLGIIPGAGGTQRLTRLVGVSRARDLVLSGRQVGAEEALAIGLADRVVPAAGLMEAASAFASTWVSAATAAIGAAKRAINEGWGLPLDAALAVEQEAFAAAFSTADAREGVSAFLEKRAPRFEGR